MLSAHVVPALTSLAAAEPPKPSGGAPTWQVVVLFAVYFGGTAGVLALLRAHRAGRTRVLAAAGDLAGWVFRVPGWAALPVTLAVVGLIGAMYGGLWDIGYHIDRGRDTGPLGNPGHFPLLLGIFCSYAGGILCVGMADQKAAGPAWVRLTPRWRAPLGGVLLLGCMTIALATLGLDDVWHQVFGQDVTLWSPTHFVFLFGGIISVIAMLVLLKEGSIAQRRDGSRATAPSPVGLLWRRVQRAALLGGLLCGLELFLAEFDWGVPLYRQVWQPLLLAAMAALIFTAARAWVGRGGALGAWVVYAALRVSGIAVPVAAGVSGPSMPLLLVEMICIELLALGLDPRRRPLAFGALGGALCGTVGFGAEYGWSQLAMPLPWTTGLLPEGPILAVTAGVGAGLLGSLIAAALAGRMPPVRTARVACVGGFALLAAAAVAAGVDRVPDARADVRMTQVAPAPQREALASVRLHPADAAEGANWLYVLAWAGGGERVVDRLTRGPDGIYRSNEPIPLYGTWKVGLRLQKGHQRGAVPMRLPVDGALPNPTAKLPATLDADEMATALRESSGAGLPAPARFTRPFGADELIVLRETKGDVPGWVWAVGIGLTALIWGLFMAGLAVGLGRMGRRAGQAAGPAPAHA